MEWYMIMVDRGSIGRGSIDRGSFGVVVEGSFNRRGCSFNHSDCSFTRRGSFIMLSID
jgi:hypothetical protein